MDSSENVSFVLKDEIDKAANHLLKIIVDPDPKISLRDRVDAFEAIVKWHNLTDKTPPPRPMEKKPNVAPIDRIKRKFDGGGAKRGRGHAEAAE